MLGAKLRIRFTGRLVQGVAPGEALKNLCTLFKTEPEKIKTVFSGKDAVVWRGSDRALAARLKAALERAGAVCEIEEAAGLPPQHPDGEADQNGKKEAGEGAPLGGNLPSGTGSPPLPKGGPGDGRGRPAENGLSFQKGKTPGESQLEKSAGAGSPVMTGIEPKLGGLDISLTPVTCYRISAVPDGLGTGRKDCSEVGFKELLLASAFKCSDQKDDYRLLLFSTLQKRPLIVDCSAIAYQEFSSATDTNMLSSLRIFLKHLHAMHPDLVFDRDTVKFLDGAPARLYAKDVTVLATALYKAREIPEAPLPCKAPRLPASPDALCCSVAPLYAGGRTGSSAEGGEDWSKRLSLVISLLLIAGFAWPLLKHSILFGSSQFIWPWQLMGFGMDAEKAAAMATISSGDSLLPWALVPLVTAILTMAARGKLSGKRRHLGFLIAGAVSTTLLFTVYFKEAELYGLILVPPTFGGGVMVLLTVFCGALVAATNHVRKTAPAGRFLRPLSALGGAVVLLAALLAIFGSDWGGWAIYPLYCLMLFAGTLGVVNALKADPDESSLNLTSLAVRGVLAWVPVAAVVTQKHADSAFVQYVINAGGGTANLAMSALKCFAIYYGCASVMALGLAGVLAAWLAPAAAPAARKCEPPLEHRNPAFKGAGSRRPRSN